MLRYKIILNPHSNRGTSLKELPRIEKFLSIHKLDYDVTQTRHPWHAAMLAREAVVDGYDVIVAAGGDGTVNEVMNGLMLAKTDRSSLNASMGILPVGRGNDFAYSMGVPASLEESCLALAQHKSRCIDIGWVCGGLYPEGRYFGNGVGIGFDAVVGFVAAENQLLRGFASYVWAALKTISLYFTAPDIEICGDDWQVHQPCLMVSIMNGRRMGGAFMMAPQSEPDDGLLDLCIVKQINKLKTLKMIPEFIRGSQYQHACVVHKRTRKLSIKAVAGTLPSHADGETLCTSGVELQIELLPKQINLVYRTEAQGELI